MKFCGLRPHYFTPLPFTCDPVFSIIPLLSYLLPTPVKNCCLITFRGEWLWEQSRAHVSPGGTVFIQVEAMWSSVRKTLWTRTKMRPGSHLLMLQEVSEQVAIPPTQKVSPDSSQFLCVSWNHFLRVTLTYVPINKLATPSQLTRLAETRSSCASVWVNSCAHSTGRDQVYQCVLLSQAKGCRKLFFSSFSWLSQKYILTYLYRRCEKLLN